MVCCVVLGPCGQPTLLNRFGRRTSHRNLNLPLSQRLPFLVADDSTPLQTARLALLTAVSVPLRSQEAARVARERLKRRSPTARSSQAPPRNAPRLPDFERTRCNKRRHSTRH